jgi:hypothetical protein
MVNLDDKFSQDDKAFLEEWPDLKEVTVHPLLNWLAIKGAKFVFSAPAVRKIYTFPSGRQKPNQYRTFGELKAMLRNSQVISADGHLTYFDVVISKIERGALGVGAYFTAAATALVKGGLSELLSKKMGNFSNDRSVSFKRGTGETDEILTNQDYWHSRQKFEKKILEERKHFMWYPGAQRSKNGEWGNSYGVFGGPYIHPIVEYYDEIKGKPHKPLVILVGSNTYDWNPEIRELYAESVAEEKMPHNSLITTLASLSIDWERLQSMKMIPKLAEVLQTTESLDSKLMLHAPKVIAKNFGPDIAKFLYHNPRIILKGFFTYWQRLFNLRKIPYGNAYSSYNLLNLDELFNDRPEQALSYSARLREKILAAAGGKGLTRAAVLRKALLYTIEDSVVVNPTMLVASAFHPLPNGGGNLPYILQRESMNGMQKAPRQMLEEIVGKKAQDLADLGVPLARTIRLNNPGKTLDYALFYLTRERVITEIKGISGKWYVEVDPFAGQYFANIGRHQFEKIK